MAGKVSVRIHYDRRSTLVALLTVALLSVGLLAYFAWQRVSAAAVAAPSPAPSRAPDVTLSGLRQYYVTSASYQGAGADTACAAGYHMASLWEILDPSNLRYNTSVGAGQADSGAGPPSYFAGWVRTGYASDTSETAGQANCAAWSSSGGGDAGTAVYLHDDWQAAEDIGAWKAYTTTCSSYVSVWCAADQVGAGTCAAPLRIDCGSQVKGDNSLGFASSIDGYSCSFWDETGPEVIYAFGLAGGAFYTVTAELGGMSGDLDVFILSSTGCGGVTGQCWGEDAEGDVVAVAGPMAPGTHYVAVDGFAGATSGYTLDLTCTVGAGRTVYLPLVLCSY